MEETVLTIHRTMVQCNIFFRRKMTNGFCGHEKQPFAGAARQTCRVERPRLIRHRAGCKIDAATSRELKRNIRRVDRCEDR